MDNKDHIVFKQLFAEAFEKCFGENLLRPLSETECKKFHQEILETTGLTVGWRTLKNYSYYLSDVKAKRDENPSIASLDTLARFVVGAPPTNEIRRKANEGHHPYWFRYKEQVLKQNADTYPIQRPSLAAPKTLNIRYVVGLLLAILLAGLGYLIYTADQPQDFTDAFKETGTAQLLSRGWMVKNEERVYWSKRNQKDGYLTLFTLAGDNWPDSTGATSGIKNILFRKLPFKCFNCDLQLADLKPKAEWQQAGLLLLSDSTLNGPSMRLSIAFNDNFGGYHKAGEIIVQGIYSSGSGARPEEFIHTPILTLDSAAHNAAIWDNLKYTNLRIIKTGDHYRILCSNGGRSDGAYREVGAKDLNFEPKYIAIVAFKGNNTTAPEMPVRIRRFTLERMACDD